MTPSGKPILIHPLGELNAKYSIVELTNLLTKLQDDEKVLKVTKTPTQDPFGMSDYNDGYYGVVLLSAFDEFYTNIQQEPEYQEFTGKKPSTPKSHNKTQSKPDRKSLKKIWELLQEIEEKKGITTKDNPVRITSYDPSNKTNEDLYEARKTILEKLQSLNALTELHRVEAGSILYWSFKLSNYYQKVFEDYQNQYKEAAKAYQQSKQMQEVKVKNPVYEVKYSERTREIFVNNFLVAKPDFDSENERVFTYLYLHPNKKISLEELQQHTGKLAKTLHKIVENLGFKNEFKTVFFSVSKQSIQFRNPITKTDLEEIKISHLKLQ
ncbi:hypothetical protein ACFL1P_01445 [Patescibacteria group bacterium]